jgi:hypothetical protein
VPCSDVRLQQDFAQLSGEGGLEAADGGEIAAAASDAQEQHDDEVAHDESDEDPNVSDVSSDGNARVIPMLGVDVSSEDKEFMVKAFLEGSERVGSSFVDPVSDDAENPGPHEATESEKNAFDSDPQSNEAVFVTPPTKLFVRSDTGIKSTASAHKPAGAALPVNDEPASSNKMKTRFQSSKSASSSKQRAQADEVHYADDRNGSQDGSSSWSERNQRDRKMAFIVVMCAATFVIFNAAAYLYLRPVKVGSEPFEEMRRMLKLQAELDLPKARFFPVSSHVAGLMNPLLVGMDRQIQTEHLKAIIKEFKDSLAHWLVVYAGDEGLQSALRDELSIGMSLCVTLGPCILHIYSSYTYRLNHLNSYTLPFLEAGQIQKAKCDMFGSFSTFYRQYSDAASHALKEIHTKQLFVDSTVYEASTTLESSIFTLMPVLTLFVLTLGGCSFTTDAQRSRLVALQSAVAKMWKRLVHRNRVYNFEGSEQNAADSGLRIDILGESRCTVCCCIAGYAFTARFTFFFAVHTLTRHWNDFLRNRPFFSFPFAACCCWRMLLSCT